MRTTYDEIEPMRKQIVDWIKVKMAVANAKTVVIGLSGGLDSAVVALLCTHAVDPGRVLGIIMPAGKHNDEDTAIAQKFGSKFLIPLALVDLSKTVSSMKKAISYPAPNEKLNTGNLCARLRMATLYWYANATNGIVVGTGNKTEESIGYFTKYGDGGVDIQPIADLYKTEVRVMAQYLGVPKEIIDRPPSAGLWKGQTDEGEFGVCYETLDTVLEILEDNPFTLEDKEPTIIEKIMADSRYKALKNPCGLTKIMEIIDRKDNAAHKLNPPPVCKVEV